jgi:lipopolysaccharide export LptBFGC system permease protein LptF
LIDGKVEITPKTDGRIDPIQLLKATYDSGVSVAEMNMIARGKIVKNASGEFTLQTEPSQSFTLMQNDLSRQLETMAGSGSYVTIKGLLYQKQKGQKKQSLPSSLTVTIIEIQQKE